MKITLRAARVNKGLTQMEAAEMLNISKETISNYENGKSFPDVKIIKKMEFLYGVSYDDINFLSKNNG